jgi:hypothetical protein
LLALTVVLSGCQSYTASTPRQVFEGNNPENYVRIFREPVPADVTIVHSVVITYSFRPGVVTTADYEFELLAPPDWIRKTAHASMLRQGNDHEFTRHELEARREKARPWYAPQPLDQYDLYRDRTSVGYMHMLVQKKAEPDGRHRVFISKH